MVGDGQAMDERRAMGAEHYILVARRKRPHDMKVPRIGPQRIPVVVRCEQAWERLYHDTLSNVPPQQLHLIPVARGKAPATPLLITNELLELCPALRPPHSTTPDHETEFVALILHAELRNKTEKNAPYCVIRHGRFILSILRPRTPSGAGTLRKEKRPRSRLRPKSGAPAKGSAFARGRPTSSGGSSAARPNREKRHRLAPPGAGSIVGHRQRYLTPSPKRSATAATASSVTAPHAEHEPSAAPAPPRAPLPASSP